MEDIKIRFGIKIRLLRRKFNVSQEELGFKSGLHRTYIGSVERGERNISIIAIDKIATALNLPLSRIFDDL